VRTLVTPLLLLVSYRLDTTVVTFGPSNFEGHQCTQAKAGCV